MVRTLANGEVLDESFTAPRRMLTGSQYRRAHTVIPFAFETLLVEFSSSTQRWNLGTKCGLPCLNMPQLTYRSALRPHDLRLAVGRELECIFGKRVIDLDVGVERITIV